MAKNKIEKLIFAINEYKAKNRQYLSIEDVDALDQNLENLKQIKIDLLSNEMTKSLVEDRLNEVIRNLDFVCGLDDYLTRCFDLI